MKKKAKDVHSADFPDDLFPWEKPDEETGRRSTFSLDLMALMLVYKNDPPGTKAMHLFTVFAALVGVAKGSTPTSGELADVAAHHIMRLVKAGVAKP